MRRNRRVITKGNTMLEIIEKVEHYWKDHKTAVIAVAVIIIVLAIL